MSENRDHSVQPGSYVFNTADDEIPAYPNHHSNGSLIL
jgi:hypothetical protein